MSGWRAGPAQWAMVAPVQALLVGVIFLPSLYVFWLSLNKSSFGVDPTFVGLANYAEILSDPYFWRAFRNTVVVVLVVVHLELLLALGAALLFAGGVPARRTMIAIMLAPYAISEVAAVVMWRFMMDPQVGMVSRALAALGLPTLEWAVEPAHGLLLAGLLSVWLHLPFTFLILYSARLALPGDLYEAARIDGASAWACFRRITVPLLKPTILFVVVMSVILSFQVFALVYVMTGGGPAGSTSVLVFYLYQQAFTYFRMGYASAIGFVLFVIIFVLTLIQFRAFGKPVQSS